MRALPQDFDLVITDFNMPGKSGIDVALEFASIRPRLPVVILSGDITEKLQIAAKQARVSLIVNKTTSIYDLGRLIGPLLASAANMAEQRTPDGG